MERPKYLGRYKGVSAYEITEEFYWAEGESSGMDAIWIIGTEVIKQGRVIGSFNRTTAAIELFARPWLKVKKEEVGVSNKLVVTETKVEVKTNKPVEEVELGVGIDEFIAKMNQITIKDMIGEFSYDTH